MRTQALVLFGLLSVVGLGAHASEVDYPTRSPQLASSPLTRAEVRHETLRALAAGEVTVGEVAHWMETQPQSGKTRAQVRMELIEARRMAGRSNVRDLYAN